MSFERSLLNRGLLNPGAMQKILRLSTPGLFIWHAVESYQVILNQRAYLKSTSRSWVKKIQAMNLPYLLMRITTLA